MAKIIGSAALAPGGDSGTDLTQKGDLHGFSRENTRIRVGTNDHVLTADSAQALGLKWAAAQGLTSPLSADLVVNDNVKILFGTGSDSGIYYDGANLYIDPDLVGTGYLAITGNLYVAGIMRSPTTTLTISGGQVTVTRNNHKIDTEGSASTDDLDGMAGGLDGMLVTLSTADGSRDVTVRDATGSNQFDLSTAGNFTMDTIFDTLFVVYRTTGTSRVWIEISRSSNT